ncbi:YciI family protein [Ideonella sp. YS5]|uniref:YciI family protein n=1 Tax=Ideonella sp. YS5 TaxID=3453714 RepID=UPI003EEBD01B
MAASNARAADPPANPRYDAELATSVGADERGMRRYVLVVLKTGPTRVPAGPERDEMFKGHFANIKRLAGEGKLALAGPFDGAEGWRGMFIFATPNVDEAKAWVGTDPVVMKGEMVAEYHPYYGSAALMLVNAAHEKVSKQAF